MGLTKPRAAQISDIDYKQAVRVVTVANITLSGGAPSLVDGVSLAKNDRILVTGQGTPSQNGIYLVATLGTGSNGTWTRTLDTDVTGELLSGTIVMVTEGNIYADTQWKLITNDPIVIGTTPLTWTQNYSANSINGGNSNVVVYNNSSVAISSAGTSNVLLVDNNSITVTGIISATGNIIPSANNLYTLGNSTNYWKSLYVSGNTIYLANVEITASGGNAYINNNLILTQNTATGNVVTYGNLSVTGNIDGANINTTGLVTATGNITGGNLITGGLATIAGNVTGANILTSGLVSAAANVTGGNLLTGGLISATGAITSSANITGSNILTGGIVSATSNITGGNILTAGQVSATGNINGNYLNANIYYATGFSASKIYLGTSEVNVTSSGGNVNVSVGGTTNVAVFTSTGADLAGNVTTVGNLSVTGNITSATYFVGNGAFLTGISGGGGGGGGDSIANAATSLGIPTASGNIIGSIQGVSNIIVMSGNTHFFKGAYSIPQTFISNVTLVPNYNSLMFGTVTWNDGYWFDIPDGAICVFSETV